jgi:hypothetical protein
MHLHVYHGDELAAVFAYGKSPTYHGEKGQHLRAIVEAWRHEPIRPDTALSDVPLEWLQWVASVVPPALSIGAFVRWHKWGQP